MAWNYDMIDLNEVMTRVLGRKELYKGWLDTFFADDALALADEAFEKRDHAAAESALHKLKGTAGNLSIKPVFEQAKALSARVINKDDFDSLADDYEKFKQAFFSAKKMFNENINDLLNYGELSI